MARKPFKDHQTDADMIEWFNDVIREGLKELGTPEAQKTLDYLAIKDEEERLAEEEDEDDEDYI